MISFTRQKLPSTSLLVPVASPGLGGCPSPVLTPLFYSSMPLPVQARHSCDPPPPHDVACGIFSAIFSVFL